MRNLRIHVWIIVTLIASCTSVERAHNVGEPTPQETVSMTGFEAIEVPSPSPTPGRECYCSATALDEYPGANVRCETEELSDGTKFYWQYDCKRIWLTLENKDGKKFVINEVPVDLHGYAYRLGYHFIKEFKKGILFRSGCSGSGPCEGYYLVDRMNGKVIKRFPQLIEIDSDARVKDPSPYLHDFVVYLAYEPSRLIVYFIEDGRTYSTILAEEPNGAIPERQFSDLHFENGKIKLNYTINTSVKIEIAIPIDR